MTEELGFHRGDVFLLCLDPVEDSEQGGTRPVLVITNDILNTHNPVVTVAAITTRKVDRVYQTEVLIIPPEGGLNQPSKVLLYQTRTVSKRRAIRYLGQLSQKAMSKVDEAIRLSLGLISI